MIDAVGPDRMTTHMGKDLLCCKDIEARIDDRSPFNRMVIFDWYDGPTSGILVCQACTAEYAFSMIDWDPQHEIRVFSLAGLPSGSLQEVIDFFGEAPEWPVWFPAQLKTPTEEFRSRLGILDQILEKAGMPKFIVAWSRSRNRPIASRPLQPEVLQEIADWFTLDDPGRVWDWFSYLGLPRNAPDLMRSRAVEHEVLDLLDKPAHR
jgi:hypothetical protein